jgi:hypothetical protein
MKVMKRVSLAVLVCAVFAANALAQCPVSARLDRDGVWKKNTAVVMWVSNDLAAGSTTIQQVVNNWARSRPASMMGVTITITTDESAANVKVGVGTPEGEPRVAGAWRSRFYPGEGVVGGTILINPARALDPIAIGQTLAHELGHPFGLLDCRLYCAPQSSVMNNPQEDDVTDTSRGTFGPTACDENVIMDTWGPEFSGSDDPCIEYCRLGMTTGDGDGCHCGDDPDDSQFDETRSPVIIDVDDDGIDLTAAAEGVDFALKPGVISRLAWTRAGDDDAWLALDRDCNGTIDDGSELFGNFTAQPSNAAPNGYSALAVFDNGDRKIDAADAIFGSLRLWTDRNHDGRSSPDEFVALSDAGIESIDLDYRTSGKHDQNGNYFRYRAKVTQRGKERWSYDVFLASTP